MNNLGYNIIDPADFQSSFDPMVTVSDSNILYEYGSTDEGFSYSVWGEFSYEYDDETLEYVSVTGTVTNFAYQWWYHDYETEFGDYYSGGHEISEFSIDLADYMSMTDEELTQQIFAGDDSITGSTSSDTLMGFSGRDLIEGGGGNDVIDGGEGEDIMLGGTDNDTYHVDNARDIVWEYANEGIDTVNASVTYTLSDNVERLVLTGSGSIRGTGNTLNNTLIGNAAANVLNGMTGADTMSGGKGNDTYIVDNAGDRIIESTSNGLDRAETSVSYSLAGIHVEDLFLIGTAAINGTGNSLNNIVKGNSGNNALNGGGGNDKLNGAAGADKLTGGTGADQFIFSSISDSTVQLAGQDTILDFSRTQGDRINLSPIDANTNAAGNQTFKFIGSAAYSHKAGELRFGLSNGDTIISGDVNGDAVADFRIVLDRGLKMIASDFVL